MKIQRAFKSLKNDREALAAHTYKTEDISHHGCTPYRVVYTGSTSFFAPVRWQKYRLLLPIFSFSSPRTRRLPAVYVLRRYVVQRRRGLKHRERTRFPVYDLVQHGVWYPHPCFCRPDTWEVSGSAGEGSYIQVKISIEKMKKCNFLACIMPKFEIRFNG